VPSPFPLSLPLRCVSTHPPRRVCPSPLLRRSVSAPLRLSSTLPLLPPPGGLGAMPLPLKKKGRGGWKTTGWIPRLGFPLRGPTPPTPSLLVQIASYLCPRPSRSPPFPFAKTVPQSAPRNISAPLPPQRDRNTSHEEGTQSDLREKESHAKHPHLLCGLCVPLRCFRAVGFASCTRCLRQTA